MAECQRVSPETSGLSALGSPFQRIYTARSRVSRSPAIRAVDRFVLVDPRCLRMNDLWPGHRHRRTAFYRNCSCRLPLKDELATQFCRFLGDLVRVCAPRTCRKSRGSRRCSVAGQIHWFQQLDVHKRLIQRKILKPDHCAQGIETPNSKFSLTKFVSMVWDCIVYTRKSAL